MSSSEQLSDVKGDEPESHRKVFVGGLSPDTTNESLNAFYTQFGSVTDAVVMKDPMTKRSRCFGFVTFGSKVELDNAQSNRPHVIDGKQVDPKRAVPREEGQRGEANISTTRLYIGNIKENHTEDMIKDHFSQYGPISKVDIVMDKATNKPRGFAFVTFEDYDAVDQAVIIKHHHIGGYRCDAKKGLSKDELAKNRERLDRSARSRGMGRNMGGPMGSTGGMTGRGGYAGGGGMGGGGYGGAPAGGYGGYAAGAGGGFGGYGQQPAAAGGWGDASSWGQAAPAAAQQGGWGQSAWAAATPTNTWGGAGGQAGGAGGWSKPY